MNSLSYNGRVAIITGAGNGIGRAYALALARRGASVVVNDINSDAADKVVAEITSAGDQAAANYESVVDGADAMVEQAVATYGKLDVLINNAGIAQPMVPISELSDADWQHQQEVHLWGTFRCTRAAMREMQRTGYGRVVMTSSPVGLFAAFNSCGYASGKAASYSLMQCLALEGEEHGVLANAIAPVAASEMTKGVFQDWWLELASPGYAAEFVAWLAHETCTKSGCIYEVGGGFIHEVRFAMTRGLKLSAEEYCAEAIAENVDGFSDFEGCSFPAVGQMDTVVNEIAATAGHERTGQSVYKSSVYEH